MRTLALFVAGLYANPCQNGGRFVDLSYRGHEEILCICAEGFEGDHCEISYGVDAPSGPGARHLGGISSFAESDRIKKEMCQFIEVTPTKGIKVQTDVEDLNQACWVFYTTVDPNYQMNIELLTIAEEGECHDDHADYYFVPDKLQVIRKMYRKNYAAEAVAQGCLHGGRVSTFGDYTYMSVVFLGGEGRTIPPTFQLTYELDANECTTGDNDCHMHANCENTVGAYACECGENHVGDGITCIDTYEKVWFDKQNYNVDLANAALDIWEDMWDAKVDELTSNDLNHIELIENRTLELEAEDVRLDDWLDAAKLRLDGVNTQYDADINEVETLLNTANTEIGQLATDLANDVASNTAAFTSGDPSNPAVKETHDTEYGEIGTKMGQENTDAQGEDTTFREKFDLAGDSNDDHDTLDAAIAALNTKIDDARTDCQTLDGDLSTLFGNQQTAVSTQQGAAETSADSLGDTLSDKRTDQLDLIEQFRSLTDSFAVFLRTNKDKLAGSTEPERVVFDGVVSNPENSYHTEGEFAGVFKATIPGLYYFAVNAKFAYTNTKYDLRLTKISDSTSADKAKIEMEDVNRLGRDYHSMSAIVWMEPADQIHVRLVEGYLYNDAGGAQTTFNGFLIHPQPTHTIA
jgi:hypothetical protein